MSFEARGDTHFAATCKRKPAKASVSVSPLTVEPAGSVCGISSFARASQLATATRIEYTSQRDRNDNKGDEKRSCNAQSKA
jgi:hypothetical protein